MAPLPTLFNIPRPAARTISVLPSMIEQAVAPHDPEFQVEWMSGGDVLEGSPSSGFQTVRIIGYGDPSLTDLFS
jgi:hypothetical protein